MYTKLKQFNDILKSESVFFDEKLAISKVFEDGPQVILVGQKGEQRNMDRVQSVMEAMNELTADELEYFIACLEKLINKE